MSYHSNHSFSIEEVNQRAKELNERINLLCAQLIAAANQNHRTSIFEGEHVEYIDLNDTEAVSAEELAPIIEFDVKSQLSIFSSNVFALFTLFYTIVIVFGLVSNLMIVVTFYSCKRLRTFRNAYIVNLAISDVLFCLLCAPLLLFRYSETTWRFGRVMCKLSSSLQIANVLLSCFSMAAIAIDRWQFIVHSSSPSCTSSSSSTSSPGAATSSSTSCTSAASSSCIIDPLGSRLAAKRTRLWFTLGLVWLLALLISLPLMFVRELHTLAWRFNGETIYSVCQETWPREYPYFRDVYCLILFLFQYILPVCIIGMSNYQICRYLHFKIPIIYRSSEHRYSDKTTSYSPDSFNDTTRATLNSRSKSCCLECLLTSSSTAATATTAATTVATTAATTTAITTATTATATKTLRNSSFAQPTTTYHSHSISVQEELLRRQRNRRYSKSCRILLYVFASFCLCWMPSTVLNLFIDYYHLFDHSHHEYTETVKVVSKSGGHSGISIALVVVHLIAVSSACLNPILYGLLNRNFNAELANLFSSMRCTAAETQRHYAHQNRNLLDKNQAGAAEAVALGGCMNVLRTTGDSVVLTDRNLSTRKNSTPATTIAAPPTPALGANKPPSPVP